MKNKIEHLRNHLFETLESLKDKNEPMELARAYAVVAVASAITETAKVEVRYLELTGEDGSGFLPVGTRELQGEQPPRQLPRLVPANREPSAG